MKKLTILAALLGILAMASVAGAQDVGVTFDEAGTVTMAPLPVGTELSVYVVGFGMTEIFGYEFLLTPSVEPNFALGSDVYGPAPQDFGDGVYEVRAGTGGCVTDPLGMGEGADSFTMARYGLLYFATADDVYYCLSASPTGGFATPIFTICDEDATKVPMFPGNVDLNGVAPDGCAVANPTMGQDIVDAEETSWGSLKAGF